MKKTKITISTILIGVILIRIVALIMMPRKVEIKYILDNQTESTVKVKNGQYLTRPEDPELLGYEFIDWYSE